MATKKSSSGSAWWNSKSPEAKKAYLERHPNSIHGKGGAKKVVKKAAPKAAAKAKTKVGGVAAMNAVKTAAKKRVAAAKKRVASANKATAKTAKAQQKTTAVKKVAAKKA